MSKDFTQAEALPHKKAGKNQTATSPNKHGCEMNDYNEHNYVKFDAYTWSHMQDKFVSFGPIIICFDCKKNLPRKQYRKFRKTADSYGNLMRYNDGNYYEVTFNKSMTRVLTKSKFN